MKILFQEGKQKKYLNKEDVLSIPQEQLPLAVLSRNYYSLFAAKISCFDRSVWNHFMWMIHPGKFLTQDWILREVPAEKYLQGQHQLKLWGSPNWSGFRRKILIEMLEKELAQPWWKHRYDVLQLIGIKIHLRRLQIPWMLICSDWAEYISVLDDKYNQTRFTPGDVNRWFEDRPLDYPEPLRFYPED